MSRYISHYADVGPSLDELAFCWSHFQLNDIHQYYVYYVKMAFPVYICVRLFPPLWNLKNEIITCITTPLGEVKWIMSGWVQWIINQHGDTTQKCFLYPPLVTTLHYITTELNITMDIYIMDNFWGINIPWKWWCAC